MGLILFLLAGAVMLWAWVISAPGQAWIERNSISWEPAVEPVRQESNVVPFRRR